MSSLWVKTWNSTPRIDCGLCSEATCASFARSLVVGQRTINECPLLALDKYKNLREQLEKLSTRKPTLVGKPAAKLPDGGMLLTKPCQDTDEKVMAELRVFNGVEAGDMIHFGVFEPGILCDLMDCIADRFDMIRCSRDLGYGRAEVEDMSITILQDGRVNMRRVSDEARVLELFRRIERALFGSIICNCCGNDVLSILAGFAPRTQAQHPALFAGSTLHLDLSLLEDESQGKVILNKASSTSVAALKRELSEFDVLLEQAKNHDFLGSSEVITGFCEIVSNAMNSADDSEFTANMVVLAAFRAVENAVNGLLGFQGVIQEAPEEIVDESLKILSDAALGRLSPLMEKTNDSVEILAHLTRVNRVINLLRDLGLRT